MKRYTDINKTKTIFHNASVIQGALSPHNGGYKGNLPSQNLEQPPAPHNNSSLRFYISVATIIVLTSLYIYSEAKHNENSVFYTMREIIELYIDQQLKEKQKEDSLFQIPNLGNQSLTQNPSLTTGNSAGNSAGSLSGSPTGSSAGSSAGSILQTQTSAVNPVPLENAQTSQISQNQIPQANQTAQTTAAENPAAATSAQNPAANSQGAVAINGLTTTEQLSKGMSAKANISQTANDIFLYFPVIDEKKDKITFTALRHGIRKDLKNLEYGNVIKDLIEQKSSQNNIYNFFNENIKVRRAWIDNDTLIIDFNRSFEYSRHGYAGLEIRIQQILWTAFNLPFLYDSRKIKNNKPIEYVSFLIGGRRKSKIGGDGMALSPFYSRDDLLKTINLTK